MASPDVAEGAELAQQIDGRGAPLLPFRVVERRHAGLDGARIQKTLQDPVVVPSLLHGAAPRVQHHRRRGGVGE